MILYSIRNRVTGREYIGTTVRCARLRWNDHISKCFTRKAETPLYVDMRELGRDAFEMVVIEEVSDYETLLMLERKAIADRNTLAPHGYNLVKGGRGNLGWRPSPSVRVRMSQGQKGRVTSDETKQKIALALRGRPSPNTGRKIGKTWNKGIQSSAQTRAKISAAHKGKPWSAKRRAAECSRQSLIAKAPQSERSIQRKAWWAMQTPERKAAQAQHMMLGRLRAKE